MKCALVGLAVLTMLAGLQRPARAAAEGPRLFVIDLPIAVEEKLGLDPQRQKEYRSIRDDLASTTATLIPKLAQGDKHSGQLRSELSQARENAEARALRLLKPEQARTLAEWDAVYKRYSGIGNPVFGLFGVRDLTQTQSDKLRELAARGAEARERKFSKLVIGPMKFSPNMWEAADLSGEVKKLLTPSQIPVYEEYMRASRVPYRGPEVLPGRPPKRS